MRSHTFVFLGTMMCFALVPTLIPIRSAAQSVRIWTRYWNYATSSWIQVEDQNLTLYLQYLSSTRQIGAGYSFTSGGILDGVSTYVNGTRKANKCDYAPAGNFACTSGGSYGPYFSYYDLGEGVGTLKADLWLYNILGQSYFAATRSRTVTISPPLTAPTLYTPINSSPGHGTSVSFSWSAIANANQYILRINPNGSGATEHVVSGTSSTQTVPSCDKIWWQARAVSADGAGGVWPSSWYFYSSCGEGLMVQNYAEPDSNVASSMQLHKNGQKFMYGNKEVHQSIVTLGQNYPNPFNPATQITFGLPGDARVRLTVFDAAGREVEVIADQSYGAGIHAVPWDGSGYPSGNYIYSLQVNGEVVATKSMILLT